MQLHTHTNKLYLLFVRKISPKLNKGMHVAFNSPFHNFRPGVAKHCNAMGPQGPPLQTHKHTKPVNF